MSYYTQEIVDTLKRLGLEGDPIHVEAAMRSEHSTLDAISRRQFTACLKRAVADIAQPGHMCDHCFDWRTGAKRTGGGK
jgi:hypothetical protein